MIYGWFNPPERSTEVELRLSPSGFKLLSAKAMRSATSTRYRYIAGTVCMVITCSRVLHTDLWSIEKNQIVCVPSREM